MNFVETVEKARNLYVEQLLGFIREHKATGKRGASEVKLQLPPPKRLFQNITCVDYLENDKDGVIAIDMRADRTLTFEPTFLQQDDLSIRLRDLHWDDVIIRFDGVAPTLNAWFDVWFDPDEKNFDANAELTGRIHSLIAEDGHISVDFGSGPADALFDLLHIMSSASIREITLETTR
jgi:hypothetical protein